MNTNTQKIVYLLLLLSCVSTFINSSTALLVGFLSTLLMGGNPFDLKSVKWGNYLLKASVIGLGFGINIKILIESGKGNSGITAIFVIGVLLVGILLGKIFKIDRVISILISVGTAICGGSAIAAVGSVLKADSNEMSVSTGTIFILNAIALFVFPIAGHFFGLSQFQFGTWAAIAIHDTSSVVGAASKYGDEALAIASITKMLRIFWIIPVSLFLVFGFKENRETFKIPLFIVGFVFASCFHSFVNGFDEQFASLFKIAKQGLVVSLFIIGSNISIESIKKVGKKVFLHALILWVTVSLVSLIYIKYF